MTVTNLKHKLSKHMNQQSSSATKTLNLLSIGQRGVGKTVFLAGSYIELHAGFTTERPQKLWFDSHNGQEQEKVEKILNYITQTGQYPPPTMKIADFNFSLKRHGWWKTKTLCDFSWWDLPGESCDFNHPKYQKLVLSSHGCCAFVNAEALVNDSTYLPQLTQTIDRVAAIASLVNQHNIKYAIALIFTKCDLLAPEPLSLLQIEEKIQPFLSRLDAANANYQKFYSSIPLVTFAGVPQLKPTGAATPILWIVSELKQLHQKQPKQDLGSGLKQHIFSPVQQSFIFRQLLRSKSLPLMLSGMGFLGVLGIAAFFWSVEPPTIAPKAALDTNSKIQAYEQLLQTDPDNFDALVELANLRIQQGQPNLAIPLMEKLVRQEPERLELQLNLAQLYKLTEQLPKAESTYDRVLLQEKDNVAALVNKALIRIERGDRQTANRLFTQAEKVAPPNLKAKVRDIAKNSLSGRE
ncbi:tetratricopeptide repeat protein [Scytonema millei]|uniref:tetratricopeptide repeat protein n=1 Tax=Scytonema millei TaxID=1245922 RepID=UPI00398BDBBA